MIFRIADYRLLFSFHRVVDTGRQGVEKDYGVQKNMEILKHNLITSLQQESLEILYEQQKINRIYCGHPDPGMVFDIMRTESLREKLLWILEELRQQGSPSKR